MDIEKLDINAVCFGILCNFPPVCGEEKAKEAVALIRSLQSENEKLRAKMEQKTKMIIQQVVELERRDTLLKEQEAELEQVKRERDVAVKTITDKWNRRDGEAGHHEEG